MAGAQVTIRMNSSANADAKALSKTWVMKAALQVASEAKRIVPVDTGYLRSSIQVQDKPDGIYVGSEAVYALSIEYGHSRKAPQGYLRPALATVMSKLGSL